VKNRQAEKKFLDSTEHDFHHFFLEPVTGATPIAQRTQKADNFFCWRRPLLALFLCFAVAASAQQTPPAANQEPASHKHAPQAALQEKTPVDSTITTQSAPKSALKKDATKKASPDTGSAPKSVIQQPTLRDATAAPTVAPKPVLQSQPSKRAEAKPEPKSVLQNHTSQHIQTVTSATPKEMAPPVEPSAAVKAQPGIAPKSVLPNRPLRSATTAPHIEPKNIELHSRQSTGTYAGASVSSKSVLSGPAAAGKKTQSESKLKAAPAAQPATNATATSPATVSPSQPASAAVSATPKIEPATPIAKSTSAPVSVELKPELKPEPTPETISAPTVQPPTPTAAAAGAATTAPAIVPNQPAANTAVSATPKIEPATPPTASKVIPSVAVLPGAVAEATQGDSRTTLEQARQLFALVDQLIKFSSDETGLPIKSRVKRQLTSRTAVENYLKQKFDEEESTKRMQRGEIVLKKFGMLDRDFVLKPFLLALLKEQIAAYYDSKTKTVYMLDWLGIDEQKPVLAHELTHALQDQHSDLEKWNDQTPADVSLNSGGDTNHLIKDEMDTAREAVVEGQATAVMLDYSLKPMGKSLVKDPELMDAIRSQMNGSKDSPILARAPLLLSESLLFPYREGLNFEQDVWMDQGQVAAFSGTLDRPPTSSWEIMNPREYEKQHAPAVPLLPDIHPLVDKLYKPYDIGQIGELDVQILTELFGGDDAARNLTPAWDGGIYWAGQSLGATTPADQASTASIALFYLSAWKSPASAQAFARLYAEQLSRKYSRSQLSQVLQNAAPSGALGPISIERDYTTEEGPVVIVTRGKLVFVSESFPLLLARSLSTLILDGQGTGETKTATMLRPEMDVPNFDSKTLEPPTSNLTGNLVRFFSDCGAMKVAVDALIHVSAGARQP
jgi:hypothetical protein